MQQEGGRERQVDLREIINAFNDRTRTGCVWEMLPHDLPAKSTVYEYYRAWQHDGTWQRVHDVLQSRVRQQEGRDVNASAGMLDSQSVKTAETRGKRGQSDCTTLHALRQFAIPQLVLTRKREPAVLDRTAIHVLDLRLKNQDQILATYFAGTVSLVMQSPCSLKLFPNLAR